MAWSSQASRVVACSIPDLVAEGDLSGSRDAIGSIGRRPAPAIGSPGVVLLSIEPALPSAGSEGDVPVVFPGYVLPVYSHEDRAHEGS
jgi:hypothetical protein